MISPAISAKAYSSGVSTRVSGMPMMKAANAHKADIRQVARRLRFCAAKKVSGFRGLKFRAAGSTLLMRAWPVTPKKGRAHRETEISTSRRSGQVAQGRAGGYNSRGYEDCPRGCGPAARADQAGN